jgi:hypothetical protein
MGPFPHRRRTADDGVARLSRSQISVVLTVALIALLATVLDSRIDAPMTRSAGAATTGPTAQVYPVPSSVPTNTCSTDPGTWTDATSALEAFFMSLPQGTPTKPIVVQFAHSACYLVNGSLDLRGFQDVTFDGNGATLEQTDVYTISYQYTDSQGAGSCQSGPTIDSKTGLQTGVWGPCDVVPNSTSGKQPLYACGNPSQPNNTLFGANTNNPGIVSVDDSTAMMWWVEGGCDLSWRNFTFQGSYGVVQRTVTDASYSTVTNASGTQVTQISSASAHFTTKDLGRLVVGPGISKDTYITAIVRTSSPSVVQLSQPATGGNLTNQTVSVDYGDASSSSVQDSLIQLNGVQRSTITNNTLNNAWGDFVTIFGVHEALPAQGNNGAFPSTDVTITNNQMTTSNRQGISPIFVSRALISGNTITAGVTTASVIDLEADASNYCHCDVNITGNTFVDSINPQYQGYQCLLCAVTTNNLDRFAFTNNTIKGQIKVELSPAAGSDINISNNTATQGWSYPMAAINFLSAMTKVDVEGNTSPVDSFTGDGPQAFVLDGGSGMKATDINVRNNTLTGTPASYGQALLDPGNPSATPPRPASVANTCGNTIPGNPKEPIDGVCPALKNPPTPPAPPTQTPVDYPAVTTVLPANGTDFGGTQNLDAVPSDYPSGISSVKFEITGGSLTNHVVATAASTLVGWVAQWNTTTVADGAYALSSVACNGAGNCSNSAPLLLIVDNTPPATAVVMPSNNATLIGAETLDATASDNVGVSSVQYEITGGSLTNHVVATATPTLFGWIGQWNATTVPDGTYTLQSVACDSAGNCGNSPPITVTVDNNLTTAVLVPSNNAALAGLATLSASASDEEGIRSVQYEITGGSLTNDVLATATLTLFGWIGQWITTTVPDGTYTLQSIATDTAGNTGVSPGITVTIAN